MTGLFALGILALLFAPIFFRISNIDAEHKAVQSNVMASKHAEAIKQKNRYEALFFLALIGILIVWLGNYNPTNEAATPVKKPTKAPRQDTIRIWETESSPDTLEI